MQSIMFYLIADKMTPSKGSRTIKVIWKNRYLRDLLCQFPELTLMITNEILHLTCSCTDYFNKYKTCIRIRK